MTDTNAPTEHFDVIVVGAGISGVGGAYHLTQQCPDKTFVVLEGLENFGGTWRMHRYPGIRSDSDLYTFGYRFKPWTGPPIATAEDIILLKLEWYRLGNETSERQWSDLTTVAKLQGDRLDRDYLHRWSTELGVSDLVERLVSEVDPD